MKSCLFLTLVVTTLIFQQSLADIRSDFSRELTDSLVKDLEPGLSQEKIQSYDTPQHNGILPHTNKLLDYSHIEI